MRDARGTTRLDIDRIFRLHLTLIGLLLLGQIAIHVALTAVDYADFTDLRAALDLDREHSIANLLSAFALAITGMVAAAAAAQSGRMGEPTQARGWTLCAAILFFIAIDEGAGLHDLMSAHLTSALKGEGSLGIVFNAWVIPYLLAFVAVAALLARFAFGLTAATRNRLIVAALLYGGAAIGLELPEGYLTEQALSAGIAADAVGNDPRLVILYTIEEIGEMIAVALTLRALLLHLVGQAQEPGITLHAHAAPVAAPVAAPAPVAAHVHARGA